MEFTNVNSMPFAFLMLLYSTFILTILLYVLFFCTYGLFGFFFIFYNAPFDTSVLSCHIIAEQDAGMMQIGEIERLIGNKLMADEGIAHRQLAVHTLHHLEAVVTTIFYNYHSSRMPIHLHLFAQVERFRHELAFHEEPARRDGILSCYERFPIGIAHHTGEEIEIICAWFAGRSHVSPHAFQGTYRDALFGIAQYLAGKELKILRRHDGSSHQYFHLVFESFEIFLIKMFYHIIFVSSSLFYK